ncbi:hypothetical protein B2A_11746, partial [mine drainage metagenome]
DEYEIGTDSFEGAAHIISKLLPQAEYDYFENEREEYEIDGMHIEIDKFPYLPYTMEIEGDSETRIMELYKKLEPGGSIEKNKSVPTAEYYKNAWFRLFKTAGRICWQDSRAHRRQQLDKNWFWKNPWITAEGSRF